MSDADEVVELLVRQRERSHIARALLDAAEALGLPARVVESQSNGYRVPKAVADAADLSLAASVDPLPGTQVYAAAPPGAKVTYERDLGPAEVAEAAAAAAAAELDEQAEPEPDELPEAIKARKTGGRR